MEDKDMFILRNQEWGCWCPGDAMSQGINSHGSDRVSLEYFRISTRRVKMKDIYLLVVAAFVCVCVILTTILKCELSVASWYHMALGLVISGSGIDLLTTCSYSLHWYCLISLWPLATNQNENLMLLAIYIYINACNKKIGPGKVLEKLPASFDSLESMGTTCLVYLYSVLHCIQ